MANPMGLMGANNPIFQVSQQRAQEASQNKNMAVQGIINQAMQQKQNEVTAKLKVNAALMESKDPYYFQKGYEGITGMMNIPADNDIMAHMEEIRNSWSELRKLEGKVDPQTFKGLVTETLTRYPGSAPEGMEKRAQQASETNWLSQATQIPGLQKQGLLTPEQATQGTQTALQGAGAKGQEVLAAQLKATEKPEKDVNEFQTFKDSYLQSNPNATGAEVVTAYKNLLAQVDKPVTQVQLAKIGHDLRGELRANTYVKDFQEVNNKYGVMKKALEMSKKTKNFVAVDQALITLYNKMTDPTSVVRESEYARTPENLSLWNRFKGKIDKYGAGGAGITQEDRQALIDMAEQFYDSYGASYDQTISDYKDLATETGISEKLIGIPYERKGKSNKTNLKQKYGLE